MPWHMAAAHVPLLVPTCRVWPAAVQVAGASPGASTAAHAARSLQLESATVRAVHFSLQLAWLQARHWPLNERRADPTFTVRAALRLGSSRPGSSASSSISVVRCPVRVRCRQRHGPSGFVTRSPGSSIELVASECAVQAAARHHVVSLSSCPSLGPTSAWQAWGVERARGRIGVRIGVRRSQCMCIGRL